MRYRNLFALIALFVSLPSQAADVNPRDYSIVPPAPEVATLMDYKEFPVDHFRGIPTINIPIYTLKSGAIEVPITISYHGGGVRANPHIGNAGLGWNVMCGSTISHTVYGAPDDAYSSTKLHGLYHLNNDEETFRQKLIDKLADYSPTDGGAYETHRYWQATLGNRYYEGKTDIANDLYNIVGYNMSGTFVRNKTGGITLCSDYPIKIASTTDIPHITDGGCDGWGFLITDNKGIQYEFLTQDRTRYDYQYGDPVNTQIIDSIYYSSAWHLDKITDLCGNNVTFTYKKRGGRVVKDVGHSVSRGYTDTIARRFNPADVFSVSSTVYYPQILKEIEANGIKVTLNYIHEGNSHADALINTINITSPSGQQRIITFKYRDNLLVSIKDGDQTIYTFDYNMDWGNDLNGYYQDFGGYLNENGVNSLIPYAVLGNQQIGFGADRSVSVDYAHTLELKKITYPTGGFTEFEWENNSFRYLKSLEFSGSIANTPHYKITTDTLRYCVEDGFSKLKVINWRLFENQPASIDLSRFFLMNPANLYQTSYEDSHKSEVYNENYPPYFPHVLIRDHNTGNIQKVYYLDKETIETEGVNQPINLYLSPGCYDFELVNPIAIQGEEEFLKKYFLYPDCAAGYIYINKMTKDNPADNGQDLWCGLRIKSIKSSTGNPEEAPLIKYFYYNTTRDPYYSTGTVQMLPKYDYMYYMVYPHSSLPGFAESEVYCMGTNAFPNTTIGSFSNIEYPQILVCMGNEDRLEPGAYLNYKAETFTYSSSRSMSNCDYNHSNFLSYQPIGSQMYTSMAHRRGNLEKHCIIGASLPVHSVEYSYNILESSNSPVLTTNAFVICDFTRAPATNTYGCYDYGIGTYSLIPYNKTVNCIHTIENDGIESYKTIEYFYDSYTEKLDYSLVKSINETDCSGLEVKTFFTYPVKNGIKLPYPETEITACGNSIMSAVRTEYDANTGLPLRKYSLSDRYALNDILSTNGITTNSQKSNISTLTFTYKYNSKGNLVEISYKDVVLASYLWGYNGMFPVIEAIGIDYETLTQAASQAGLSPAQINGREISDANKILSVANVLRKRFTDKTISSISYDWFYGILHFTDGRGIRTTNEYDKQGRLTSTRDFNNYIISKFEYHYATD